MENQKVSNDSSSIALEGEPSMVSESESINQKSLEKSDKENTNKDDVEVVFNSLEEGFLQNESINRYAFPHPRQWIGPRLLAIWVLPIIGLNKIRKFLYSLYIYLCE